MCVCSIVSPELKVPEPPAEPTESNEATRKDLASIFQDDTEDQRGIVIMKSALVKDMMTLVSCLA